MYIYTQTRILPPMTRKNPCAGGISAWADSDCPSDTSSQPAK